MNSKKQTNSPPFATTFIAKYFAIPPFFHTFATAKRAHQALRYWFRSSVGLEQQPSKLWVLGSNPNGITECYKRNIRKDIPLFLLIISILYHYELRS